MISGVDENVNLLISRKILTAFNGKVFPAMNDTQSKSLALFMLDKVRPFFHVFFIIFWRSYYFVKLLLRRVIDQ